MLIFMKNVKEANNQIMVPSLALIILLSASVLPTVWAGVPSSSCEDTCQHIPANLPEGACKAFTRAVPKSLGRTCTQNFQDGWAVACRLLCAREEGHLSHSWIDRLSYNACQDMSGSIPYPAVFNSCKTGYRSGVAAASAAVSQRLGKSGRSDGEIDKIGLNAVEAKVQPRATGSFKGVSEQDVEAWMESLEMPQKYVDYAAVAKERVSAARRTRGSDAARGPECPVCSG